MSIMMLLVMSFGMLFVKQADENPDRALLNEATTTEAAAHNKIMHKAADSEVTTTEAAAHNKIMHKAAAKAAVKVAAKAAYDKIMYKAVAKAAAKAARDKIMYKAYEEHRVAYKAWFTGRTIEAVLQEEKYWRELPCRGINMQVKAIGSDAAAELGLES